MNSVKVLCNTTDQFLCSHKSSTIKQFKGAIQHHCSVVKFTQIYSTINSLKMLYIYMAPLTSLWACSRRSCLLTLSLQTRSQAELSSIRSDCKLDVSPSDLLMISLADFWTNATVVARAPSSCWNACKAREECWQCGALQTLLSTLILDLVTHAGLCWSISQTWGCDGV